MQHTALYMLMIVVPFLTMLLLSLNGLLASVNPDMEKASTYECGYDTIRGQTRAPFSISFYLVDVLFLAFDLEVATLMPLATTMSLISLYGYWIVVIFFALLTLGFVLEIGSGALKMSDQRHYSSSTPVAYGDDQL
jgi:NADH:ubiquinone oxidoreductase subunit 3 (subunit A)